MQNNAQFIMFENEAYYKMLEEVLTIAKETAKKEAKSIWIDEVEAMELLGISSKSTLQRFRDEDRIVFSMPTSKNIKYNRKSILSYLDSKSNKKN